MSAEEVGHCAIGLDVVAKRWVRREPVEEGEERERGERVGVEVDEVDNVTGCEGREELSERGVQRLRVLGGGFNGVGDG